MLYMPEGNFVGMKINRSPVRTLIHHRFPGISKKIDLKFSL